MCTLWKGVRIIDEDEVKYIPNPISNRRGTGSTVLHIDVCTVVNDVAVSLSQNRKGGHPVAWM